MTWHHEVVDEETRVVLGSLADAMNRWGLYLGGGTAVALHLGHRRSQDLDWFSRERIPDMMRLVSGMRDMSIDVVVDSVERGTLHLRVSDIPVSVLEYPYELLAETVLSPELGFELASLEDLACMKLSAIAQRGSRKDFLDIYAIGMGPIPLDQMLELYREKYGIEDVTHVLYGLAYFDDADAEAMPTLIWDLDWEAVRATVRGWVRGLTR